MSSKPEAVAARNVVADVRNFILERFPLARKQPLSNSDALLESGKIDSQGVLELVSFIEREFAATVDDDDLTPENFQTIDRIAAYIQSKTDSPAA